MYIDRLLDHSIVHSLTVLPSAKLPFTKPDACPKGAESLERGLAPMGSNLNELVPPGGVLVVGLGESEGFVNLVTETEGR
jgi:hypothetical protein